MLSFIKSSYRAAQTYIIELYDYVVLTGVPVLDAEALLVLKGTLKYLRFD